MRALASWVDTRARLPEPSTPSRAERTRASSTSRPSSHQARSWTGAGAPEPAATPSPAGASWPIRAKARPLRGERPSRPSHEPATARAAPLLAHSPRAPATAAGPSQGSTATDNGSPVAGTAPASAFPVPVASTKRSHKVRNSRNSNSRRSSATSQPPTAASAGTRDTSRSRTSGMTRALLRTEPSPATREARSRGVSSSRWAYTPSRSP